MFRSPLRIVPGERGNVEISLGAVPPGPGIIRISARMAPESGGMVRSLGRAARHYTETVAECV
jgi:hypothetical protein